MIKTLLLVPAILVVSTISSVVHAQGMPAAGSEIPASGSAAAAPAAPSVSLSYNVGIGPINLRPGAYINRSQSSASTNGADTTPGRVSAPVDKPTSAMAYNQNLVKARLQAQRISNSVIPSPFPEGF